MLLLDRVEGGFFGRAAREAAYVSLAFSEVVYVCMLEFISLAERNNSNGRSRLIRLACANLICGSEFAARALSAAELCGRINGG